MPGIMALVPLPCDYRHLEDRNHLLGTLAVGAMGEKIHRINGETNQSLAGLDQWSQLAQNSTAVVHVRVLYCTKHA